MTHPQPGHESGLEHLLEPVATRPTKALTRAQSALSVIVLVALIARVVGLSR